MHFTEKISFKHYITDDQVQYAFNEYQYEKFEEKHKGKDHLKVVNFPSELERMKDPGMTFAKPKTSHGNMVDYATLNKDLKRNININDDQAIGSSPQKKLDPMLASMKGIQTFNGQKQNSTT